MTEFVGVLIATIAVAGVLTLAAVRLEYLLRWVERALLYGAALVILWVMVWVGSEVVARYAFNSPLEGHLEGAELLLPIIVFFGISFAQARDDHVGMTLVVDALSEKVRRNVNLITLVLSVLTCAVLAYFSAKFSYRAWDYDDVTMSPPYWPTWPSAVAVPIGYLLISVRMYLQILLVLMPDRMPEPEIDDSELHVHE
ncbi:MAG: TRAP transporter small permease [Rhodospirillaceae bacterium]|nr:TRAP transporter small permease [Rhodospirillaceae bacterium]MBT6137601.1 TRAP transporter small permease [Rhodospirillaceae bacterium]